MAKSATKKEYSATSIAGVFASQRMPLDQLPSHVEGRPVLAYAIDPDNEHILYFATRPIDESTELRLEWRLLQ